jgi:hypothetical protein
MIKIGKLNLLLLIVLFLIIKVSTLELVEDITLDNFEKEKLLSCLQLVTKRFELDTVSNDHSITII